MTLRVVDRSGIDLMPMTLESEREALAKRLESVKGGAETLLIAEVSNFFSTNAELRKIAAFILAANAIAMWKTARPVVRLLILSGDISMQDTGRLFAFANEFRALMQGGYARIDNVPVWMQDLNIFNEDDEPYEIRDFRRAVRMFAAARISPQEVPGLTRADWYFGFRTQAPQGSDIGHFTYQMQGSHSALLSVDQYDFDITFQDRFTSGPCEMLSTTKAGIYRLSIDFTGIRDGVQAGDALHYLNTFAGLIL